MHHPCMVSSISTGVIGKLVLSTAWRSKHIPVYLPTPLVAKIDGVAHAEMRTRTNATAWLVAQALRSRELAEAEARSEAS
jgi:hypothetical protein